jgi:hypothetical protein
MSAFAAAKTGKACNGTLGINGAVLAAADTASHSCLAQSQLM